MVSLHVGEDAWPVCKTVTVDSAGRLGASYAWGAVETASATACAVVEISLSLFRDTSPCAIVRADGTRVSLGDAATRHTESGCIGLDIRDEVRQAQIALRWSEADALAVYPIETVSLSEDGFERVLQGVTITPVWRAASLAHRTITIRVHAVTWAANGMAPVAAAQEASA